MRRILTIGFMASALMIAVGATGQAVEAKAPAFKKAPTFTEIGMRLNSYGSITGVEASANYPDGTQVLIIAYGTLTVDCYDSVAAPTGVATASFGNVQGLQFIADSQLRPSGMAFSATTAVPSLTPAQAGCPAGSTFTINRDTTYTIARIVVFQEAGGTIVLDQTLNI